MDGNTQSNRSLWQRIAVSLRITPKPRKVRQTEPTISLPEPPTLKGMIGTYSIPAPATPAAQALYIPTDGKGVNVFPSPSATNTQTQPDLYGDRERTERRYKEAVEQLEKSLKLPTRHWKTFEIPDFKAAD